MKHRLRANDFLPHDEDRIGVETMAELGSRFAITSRSRVWSVSATHRFSDADTKYLFKLPRLAELNLFHFTNMNSRFTHCGVANVLTHTRIMAFGDCNNSLLGDDAAKHISISPRLRWVKLPNCGITDRGVSMISQATQLIGLSLTSNPISDQSVPAICELSKLRHLWISDTEISPEGHQEISARLENCRIHHP